MSNPFNSSQRSTRACLTLSVLAAALMLTSVPANAADPQGVADPRGFIYGKITTRSGSTFEGRMRWGKEEAFWGDHFNSVKEDRPFMHKAPRRERRERETIKVFGITIGTKWESMSSDRSLIARFGDIQRIEVRHSDEATLVLKNGSELRIDGGSNDLGGKVHIWDQEVGEIDVRWSNIEEIEMLPTPRNLEVDADRLYGTVETRRGEFRGYIQWDQDECLSTDKLDGESRDGKMSIEMGKIRSIDRHTRDSSRIVLKSGRELVLEGSNDVDSDNRGIFVEDERYGRVLVEWDAFERLVFADPETTGPGYRDFPPAKSLSGKVIAENGEVHEGRIVYDLDESETWEILGGDQRDISYHIPFGLIASIIPESIDSSLIILKSGEKLELEDSADVGGEHDGVLVLDSEEDRSVYLAWSDVQRIDFDPR
ncbi:MAG: hypothetical protein AAF560_06370 [Acidobacteriota bacterium]